MKNSKTYKNIVAISKKRSEIANSIRINNMPVKQYIFTEIADFLRNSKRVNSPVPLTSEEVDYLANQISSQVRTSAIALMHGMDDSELALAVKIVIESSITEYLEDIEIYNDSTGEAPLCECDVCLENWKRMKLSKLRVTEEGVQDEG